MQNRRRTRQIRKFTVTAVCVGSVLGAGLPAAEASAATTPLSPVAAGQIPSLPSLQPVNLPAFTPGSLSFVGPSSSASVAIGPTVIGSVFNGGTTVCVSTVASNCGTVASP